MIASSSSLKGFLCTLTTLTLVLDRSEKMKKGREEVSMVFKGQLSASYYATQELRGAENVFFPHKIGAK